MIAPGRQSSSESSPYVLDPDSAAPLYHQIRESLRGAIEDSLLESGQMLPSERELTLTYGVNRLTLRQAMGELVHEGLLRREHGVGTWPTNCTSRRAQRCGGCNGCGSPMTSPS
jgi:DNA-binding GntR family transcriptional regulator